MSSAFMATCNDSVAEKKTSKLLANPSDDQVKVRILLPVVFSQKIFSCCFCEYKIIFVLGFTITLID